MLNHFFVKCFQRKGCTSLNKYFDMIAFIDDLSNDIVHCDVTQGALGCKLEELVYFIQL